MSAEQPTNRVFTHSSTAPVGGKHPLLEAACVYARWDDLQVPNLKDDGVENPLEDCIAALSSDNWKVQFDSLSFIQAVAKHRPEIIRQRQEEVVAELVQSCASLRSGVARNALITLGRVGVAVDGSLSSALDSLLPLLINKSANTAQKFLADAAWDVCQVVCSGNNVCAKTVLDLGCLSRSKNPTVVSLVAKLLLMSIETLRDSGRLSIQTVKDAISPASHLLEERMATTKKNGRELVEMLVTEWIGSDENEGNFGLAKSRFDQFVNQNVEDRRERQAVIREYDNVTQKMSKGSAGVEPPKKVYGPRDHRLQRAPPIPATHPPRRGSLAGRTGSDPARSSLPHGASRGHSRRPMPSRGGNEPPRAPRLPASSVSNPAIIPPWRRAPPASSAGVARPPRSISPAPGALTARGTTSFSSRVSAADSIARRRMLTSVRVDSGNRGALPPSGRRRGGALLRPSRSSSSCGSSSYSSVPGASSPTCLANRQRRSVSPGCLSESLREGLRSPPAKTPFADLSPFSGNSPTTASSSPTSSPGAATTAAHGVVSNSSSSARVEGGSFSSASTAASAATGRNGRPLHHTLQPASSLASAKGRRLAQGSVPPHPAKCTPQDLPSVSSSDSEGGYWE